MLPTAYATSIGSSPEAAAGLVSLLNCATTTGTILFGFLVDYVQATTLVFVCSMGCAVSVFVFWGLATSQPLLWILALTYGIFAGGYAAIYTSFNREVKKHACLAEHSVLMGSWAAGRGIGAVVSGPVSEKLLHLRLWKGDTEHAFAYGTEYGVLIIFVEITAILSSVSVILKYFDMRREDDRDRRTEHSRLIEEYQ